MNKIEPTTKLYPSDDKKENNPHSLNPHFLPYRLAATALEAAPLNLLPEQISPCLPFTDITPPTTPKDAVPDLSTPNLLTPDEQLFSEPPFSDSAFRNIVSQALNCLNALKTLHVNITIYLPIEISVRAVNRVQAKVMDSSHSKDNSNALGHKPAFIVLHRAICIVLDLEDPLAANNLLASRSRDKFPSAIAIVSIQLLKGSLLPLFF
ncbi:hypothetical protein K503DRAFT_803488 [Rhizopogon vinicolor AM-OR11-026]|uniref:Uncharacterized protein n=1 Tax=Rhizopogon vinicolor AM-OR11-026 TaxID=1314800 RepID=A0A1B7MPN2_9AGAM|nr:hypothetical protein K503DRAFT_803488 [Rhizopogon vinicolor AM-OR11-026]